MVYLLHYERALFHAQHYIGYAETDARIDQHANGTSGAHLPAAFFRAGVSFTVSRTWDGDRTFERRLKKSHNARILCPLCRPAKLKAIAAIKRAWRVRKRQNAGAEVG